MAKVKYQLDRLVNISLLKLVGCLGHYLPETIRALQKTIQQSTAAILDKAAKKAIDSSQRIFLACNCVDWNVCRDC